MARYLILLLTVLLVLVLWRFYRSRISLAFKIAAALYGLGTIVRLFQQETDLDRLIGMGAMVGLVLVAYGITALLTRERGKTDGMGGGFP